MPNTPKPPSDFELATLTKYKVDFNTGEVFGPSGKSVGTIASDGYYRVSITSIPGQKQRGFRRCHIVWWAYYGKWPIMEIDHDDRNKLNDCIGNLKEATRNENSANRERPIHKLLPGVHFRSRMKTNPYAAVKTYAGKTKWIGYYPTAQQAHEAYLQHKEQPGE